VAIFSKSPVERARALNELIRREALESERLGQLTDKVAAALLEANLFSTLVPEPEGGLGAGRAEFFETVEEVSRADGSAGWCLSVCSVTNFAIHKAASHEARQEVFGSGPVALWASLIPRARSTAVNGGYRVSGSFGLGSGSSLARWVLVAEELPDLEGQQWFRAYIVPKEDVDIKTGSWDAMGLRATASVDYTIVDKFVPSHRTFEYPFLQTANPVAFSAQFGIFLNQIGLTAFASGVGSRALSELIAAAPKTKRLVGEGFQADDNVVQFGIGELEGRMRAARSQYLSLVVDQDRHIAAHGAPNPLLALDAVQAAQTLTRAARDMTVFAYDHSSTGVILSSDPMQRCLRDIFAGLKHASFTPALLTRVGKARLGLGVPITRLR
jgi:alkylation response protein AidB-like acyl-CoA dehydrogenase